MAKKLMKTIVFLLIFLILFLYVSHVVSGKWTAVYCETYVADSYYELKDQDIEVALLGSSQTVTGFSAMEMYKQTGVSAAGVATPNQSMLSTYYWLREMDSQHDLSTVVVDVSMLFEKTNDTFFRKAMDNMHMSLNKIAAIRSQMQMEDGGDFWSYIFKPIEYHGRWNELTDVDFKVNYTDTGVFRGNVLRSEWMDVEYEDLMIDQDEVEEDKEFVDYEEEWFYQIIDYCKENELNLLLVKTPKSAWSMDRHNAVQKVADEENVPFLDMNFDSVLQEIGLDSHRDMLDPDHTNIYGTLKVSDYLAGYLAENYELTDYRGTGMITDGDVTAFDKECADEYLLASANAQEYLEQISDARYDVVISVSEDISDSWDASLQAILQGYGMTVDLATLKDSGYNAFMQAGQAVYQNLQAGKTEDTFTTRDGTVCEVSTDPTEKKINFSYNKEEYEFAGAGVNIAVLDTEKGVVVDIVTLCYDSNSKTWYLKR